MRWQNAVNLIRSGPQLQPPININHIITRLKMRRKMALLTFKSGITALLYGVENTPNPTKPKLLRQNRCDCQMLPFAAAQIPAQIMPV